MKTAHKYQVKTETKGILYFDSLPVGTYFLEGVRDPSERGQAMFYCYDNGTCLIPIQDERGQNVFDPGRAGEEIKRK